MNFGKRILSLLLALVLVVGLMPTTAFTALAAEPNETVTTNPTDSSEPTDPTGSADPVDLETIAVESITLDIAQLQLEEAGQTRMLTATVLPENATDKTVTWSSSDEAVATVAEDGTVTAIANGEATITATAGAFSATCVVTIEKAEESDTKPVAELTDFAFSVPVQENYVFSRDTKEYNVTLSSPSSNYTYMTATFPEGCTASYSHNNGAETGTFESGVKTKTWLNFNTEGATTVLTVTISNGTDSTVYTFNITRPAPVLSDDNTLYSAGIRVETGTYPNAVSHTVMQADETGTAGASTEIVDSHKYYACELPAGSTSFYTYAMANGDGAVVRYRVNDGAWATWSSWSPAEQTAPAKVDIQIASAKDYADASKDWDNVPADQINSFTLWVRTEQPAPAPVTSATVTFSVKRNGAYITQPGTITLSGANSVPGTENQIQQVKTSQFGDGNLNVTLLDAVVHATPFPPQPGTIQGAKPCLYDKTTNTLKRARSTDVTNANFAVYVNGVKYGCSDMQVNLHDGDTVEIDLTILPTALTLNNTALTLNVGGEQTLTASVTPTTAAAGVIWTSDNESVATVVDGVVTAVAPGSANITVTSTVAPAIQATCAVTVTAPDPVTNANITLSVKENGVETSAAKEIALSGEKSVPGTTSPLFQMMTELFGDGNSNVTVLDAVLTATKVPIQPQILQRLESVKYDKEKDILIRALATDVTDDNFAVYVNGRKLGCSDMQVNLYDGDTVAIEVTILPTALTLDNTTLTLNVGGERTLTASITPRLAAKEVSWTSDNEAVATVADGVVTAVAPGSATITATSAVAPDIQATCTVTVEEAVDYGKVRVIVENTTYSVSSGAPWDGTLVDMWVNLTADSTAMSAVVEALTANGYTQVGAENNYISSINGLAAYNGGQSGWMGTLNDWFTSEGFGAYSVKDGNLSAGDEVRIMYTCNGYGADLGGSWENNDKTLKALSFSVGTLSAEFSGDVHEYILTVPYGTTSVVVTPTAANKNFQVRTYVGETEYKRTATVPVEEGTVITVKCGDPSWPTMNSSSDPAQVYTVSVKMAPKPVDEADRLTGLAFSAESGSTFDSKLYTMSPAFDPAVAAYTVFVPDSSAGVCIKATGSGKTINAVYTNTSGRETTKSVTSGQATALSSILNSRTLTGNTLTITVNGNTAYTVTFVRQPSIRTLAMTGLDGTELKPTSVFSPSTYAYTVYVPAEGFRLTATVLEGAGLLIGRTAAVSGEAVAVTPQWGNHEATLTLTATREGTPDTTYTLTLVEQPSSLEITKAPDKTEYKVGETFDPTGMEVMAHFADGTSQVITDYTLSTTKPLANEEKITLTWRNVTVDQEITVPVLPGTGTQEDPFAIYTVEDAILFRDKVNAGANFAGQYVKLMENIELPEDWTPVGSGSSKTFQGAFEGNNKLITVAPGSKTFFGSLSGGAVVQNLNILGTKIAGAGVVDYYTTGQTYTLDNITLKSGTQTLCSGFMGGYGNELVYIKNSTVESGVLIGYDGTQSNIGSFGGDFNGSITNCQSGATVQGVNWVGGIVGNKGQTMRDFVITGCTFTGKVIATGKYAGGISGGGYGGTRWGLASAPNTPGVIIKGCTFTGSVQGNEYVGGILGAEAGLVQCWSNGIGYIQNNISTGTVSGSAKVGQVIGYMHSLNKYTIITGNCHSGSLQPLGGVWLVDTNCATHETSSGATYICTEGSTAGCPSVSFCSWKKDHHRTDDPLGADIGTLFTQMSGSGEGMQALTISGYQTAFVQGDAFAFGENAKAIVTWKNGTATYPAIAELTVEGYDPNTLGEQTLTVKYESVSTQIKITVSERPVVIPTLTGMTVSNIKTSYVQGQELDLTGAVFTVSYSDDTTRQLTADEIAQITVTGFDTNNLRKQTVVLSYLSVSATVDVTVIPKVVTNLTVTGQKTEYILGDAFTLDGATITATWNDDSTTTVDAENVTASGYDADTQGKQTVTLSYMGISATYEVTVTKPETDITVYFTLLGDSKHGESDHPHGLAMGGLTTWISKTSFTVSNNATVKDVLEMALTAKGYSWSNPSGNYVSAINGLAEFDNGSNSGWMYTLNGSYPLLGVSEQYLNDGDVIIFHYTDDYTVERHGFEEDDPKEDAAVKEVIEKIDAIGTVSYTNTSKQKIDAARKAYDDLTYAQKQEVTNYSKLQAAEKAYADLKKADDQKKADAVDALIDKIDAEITLDSEAEIVAARSAYDKLTADQKALVKDYRKLTDAETALAELKATEADKEKAQEVIDMIDKLGTVTPESEEAVKAARAAYDKLTDVQKALITNYNKLEAAEKELARLKDIAPALDAYKITGDYLEKLGEPEVGSIGGEWMVIGLIRSDREVSDSYYEKVLAYVKENVDENGRLHANKSTDNSRIILALTAIGKDATNVGGIDLIAGLSSMEYIQKQGINGPIWALIALDSGNYPVPADGDVTRDALIQVILDAQLPDGGWAIGGSNADADMTGMALQALAPYYGSNSKVKAAVDKGVDCLSQMQHADGGYGSVDGPSSESIAQVIVALTALGIDPHTDSRFVKNGSSAVDALLTYFVEGGGFKHIQSGELNGMATEQGYYALTAYNRFLEGQKSLYDMTDVLDKGRDVRTPVEPDATEPDATVPTVTEPADVDDGDKGGFPWLAVIVVIVLGAAVAIVIVLRPKRKHIRK